ncbi:MAG: HEAT repeat domain-containing protein [candidate division KSB1 bacterium]|nr:HEAT repeat domain-containing protein [candidate division KSB1 bacterium]
MRRKLFHLTNLSLLLGGVLVAYVIYASSRHAMSWTKLVLFWAGVGAMALFFLYHILVRRPERWQGRPIRHYSLIHRAVCAILLLVGIFAATGFSYHTWQIWQLPALYWEPMGIHEISRQRFEILMTVGNQRYYRSLLLQEVQLVLLSDPAPPNKAVQVTLQIDSLRVLPHTNPFQAPSFVFANALTWLPLERRELRLVFRTRNGLAVYQLQALYREHGTSVSDTVAFANYLLLENNQASFVDFTELATRARQPSHTNQSMFIHAVARSHHPLALGTLLDILKVRDVRIQNVVCEALALLGDSRAVPALIELVQNTNNPQALNALGELRSKAAVDFLIETLQEHRDAFLRAQAAEALGHIAVPAHGEFERAIPVLVSKLRYGSGEDAFVQREAMLALARISDTLAIPTILDYARRHHSGQALRNLLDVTSILGDKWLLPQCGAWLQDWRGYNLDLDDVQLLLNYLVVTRHYDMVQVLIDALDNEISAEAQAKMVHALFQLTGKDFGELQHPVLNLATEKANRRILNRWQNWWQRVQQDSLYREQVKPIG